MQHKASRGAIGGEYILREVVESTETIVMEILSAATMVGERVGERVVKM